MADKEYLIFCDESAMKGRFYSNFYGGILVGSSQYTRITKKFTKLKEKLHIKGEVKWSKVSVAYLGKYQDLMDSLFKELAAGHLKIRIMFRENKYVATNLTEEQVEGSYFRLYYQFIKHGFGLTYRPLDAPRVSLRLFFDAFPDQRESVSIFKGHIHALASTAAFRSGKIFLKKEDIAEVRSHDHILLQMLDVVLGAMNFRLNDLHKEKVPGSRFRGNRTKAKETLYKHIFAEIRKLYPGFNIGISTGTPEGLKQRWTHPYRHWSFIPAEHEVDVSHTKNKGPVQPT